MRAHAETRAAKAAFVAHWAGRCADLAGHAARRARRHASRLQGPHDPLLGCQPLDTVRRYLQHPLPRPARLSLASVARPFLDAEPPDCLAACVASHTWSHAGGASKNDICTFGAQAHGKQPMDGLASQPAACAAQHASLFHQTRVETEGHVRSKPRGAAIVAAGPQTRSW